MKLTEAVLSENKLIAENTIQIKLTPGEKYSYRPGQHADCFLYTPYGQIDSQLNRTLSFCSTPKDKEISFIFRSSSSRYKQKIIGLPLGSRIALSQPSGYFGQSITEIPTLLIAGGVGIAPFRSLLYFWSERESPLHLITVNRSHGREIFHYELEQAERKWQWFNYTNLVTNKMGRKEKDQLIKKAVIKAQSSWQFENCYICGPSGFVDQIRELLATFCLDQSRIKSEDFGMLRNES